MMSPRYTQFLRVVIAVVMIVLALLCCLRFGNDHRFDPIGYAFAVINNTGRIFGIIMSGMIAVGAYIILDRIVFNVVHLFFSKRLVSRISPGGDRHNVFSVFREHAYPAAGVGGDSNETIARARDLALRKMLNGQEIDRGRSCLEFLGMIAPMVGFIGTLVGLIGSFHELGLGGELTAVLEGLAVAMTTSLLGVVISLVCISAAWLLGQDRQAFDAELNRIFAADIEDANDGEAARG